MEAHGHYACLFFLSIPHLCACNHLCTYILQLGAIQHHAAHRSGSGPELKQVRDVGTQMKSNVL